MNSFFDQTISPQILDVHHYFLNEDEVIHAERSSHGLVYFLAGNHDYLFDSVTLHASPDSVLYLPRKTPYVIHRVGPAEVISVDVLLSPTEPPYPPLLVKVEQGNFLKSSFEKMFSVEKRKTVGYETELLSYYYAILSAVQRITASNYLPPPYFQRITPALNYIESNFTSEDLKVAGLAALCDMSESWFLKIFHSFFMVSPKEYIIRMRLDYAKQLLISTSDPIKTVSRLSGFSDIYYFSRLFKTKTGFTPVQYRREYFAR